MKAILSWWFGNPWKGWAASWVVFGAGLIVQMLAVLLDFTPLVAADSWIFVVFLLLYLMSTALVVRRTWLTSPLKAIVVGIVTIMMLLTSSAIYFPPTTVGVARMPEHLSRERAERERAEREPAAWLVRMDELFATLEWANIAFNTPATLKLRQEAVIVLLLSLNESIEELRGRIAAVGEKEGARIQVSDRMEARLAGSGFRIDPVTPSVQAIGGPTSEWRWGIRAVEVGPQQLSSRTVCFI